MLNLAENGTTGSHSVQLPCFTIGLSVAITDIQNPGDNATPAIAVYIPGTTVGTWCPQGSDNEVNCDGANLPVYVDVVSGPQKTYFSATHFTVVQPTKGGGGDDADNPCANFANIDFNGFTVQATHYSAPPDVACNNVILTFADPTSAPPTNFNTVYPNDDTVVYDLLPVFSTVTQPPDDIVDPCACEGDNNTYRQAVVSQSVALNPCKYLPTVQGTSAGDSPVSGKFSTIVFDDTFALSFSDSGGCDGTVTASVVSSTGYTGTQTVQLSTSWSGTVLSMTQVVNTYVNGILTSIGTPFDTTIDTGDDCS